MNIQSFSPAFTGPVSISKQNKQQSSQQASEMPAMAVSFKGTSPEDVFKISSPAQNTKSYPKIAFQGNSFSSEPSRNSQEEGSKTPVKTFIPLGQPTPQTLARLRDMDLESGVPIQLPIGEGVPVEKNRMQQTPHPTRNIQYSQGSPDNDVRIDLSAGFPALPIRYNTGLMKNHPDSVQKTKSSQEPVFQGNLFSSNSTSNTPEERDVSNGKKTLANLRSRMREVDYLYGSNQREIYQPAQTSRQGTNKMLDRLHYRLAQVDNLHRNK